MNDRSQDPPQRPADELQREVDRLRLENQRLRSSLAESTLWPKALRHLTDHTGEVARRYVRRLRRRVGGGSAAATTAPAAAPYVVQRLHGPQEDRPRILHVISNFHVGGSSRLIVDLVEHLDHRFEQSVAAWDVPASPAYVGVRITKYGWMTPDLAAHVIARDRPALIHVHNVAHHLGAALNEHNGRSLAWYRPWFTAAEHLGVPVIENVNIPTEPYVSDAVVCYVHVSDFVRQRYGRMDGRHVTIFPGSDLGMFGRDLDAEPATDCIGMVYRLQSDKLDERSIEPFIETVQRRPGTRALIVGGGDLHAYYVNRVRAAGLLDAFTFTGYVPYSALPSLFEQMSLFVTPVHTESFGQVSVFAMGMGLPVAGYDVGALTEIAGDPELFAPPGNAVALADILTSLLDDPARCRTIGRRNQQRAKELFSVKSMIDAYERLYDELAVGRARDLHNR